MSEPRRATLYRMVMPEHTCPWGLKAKYFLEYSMKRIPICD